MINRYLSCLILATLISGCGMTGGQKAQIATFATATSIAISATAEKMIDIRSQVIEIRKERINSGDLEVKDATNLESTLKASKVAQQVATMRLLQAYANSLNTLATNDQTEAIRKAVTHLSTSAEAAANTHKNDANKVAFSDAQRDAAAGIAATIGGWYIEKLKKDAIEELVEKYSPLINDLAGRI